MSVSDADRRIVEGMFQAMQAGPSGEGQMMALFADDAVFTESFSGEPRTHEGRDAIRTAFVAMSEGPPDMELTVNRVDIDGEAIRADWTCTSAAFPSPMKGYDLFRIEDGRIKRLDVVVTDMPPMEH